MSALNKDETNYLQHARAVLSHVLRNGFDPSKTDKETEYTRDLLRSADRGVKTVITIKGHYPK